MPDDPKTLPPPLLTGLLAAFLLGVFDFTIFLLWHNVADGDLWARLAVGAAVHHTGHPWLHDIFAFTPVLPLWIDHEWGSGVVFFTVLKHLGSMGLMALKILLAFLALGFALASSRRSSLAVLLLVAAPCAWALLPGYTPVIRCHAFSYALFALTVWVCTRIQDGRTPLWPLLPLVMLAWANLHGGFVTGFAVIGVFLLVAVVQRGTWRPLLLGLLSAGAVTLVNPYGPGFYTYLVPALLHPRPDITEWWPMMPWGWDAFTGFRVTFLLACLVLLLGWRRVDAAARRQSWPGLILLALTTWMAWQHRRHASFFGIVAASVLPLYLQGLIDAAGATLMPPARAKWLAPILALLLILPLTGGVVLRFLPGVAAGVLAPVGLFPVRECDILARAGASGNLAVPFAWGSYASWRLYPRVKVSMDGRYEECYPESTFLMNKAFYYREGSNWDTLVTSNKVDFVMVDNRNSDLTPADLESRGFRPVRLTGLSSLWCRPQHEEALTLAAATLPDTTIDPFDALIPAAWPWRPPPPQP